jgi:pimeloyl-ACP methyl ester carboxylesterase
MGKNKERPKGYKPYLEFYLRRDPEGGKLLTPSVFHGALDAQARRECLVLVHGFNNSDSGAADAYFAFRDAETKIFNPIDASVFEGRFGDTFWPGDADWSFFDKLDFLIYPSAVHTAVKAANELANLLWKMPNLERVDFIGHSLGCRVTLETLLLLRQRTLPMIGRVVLMAAAVPSEMLERGGKFFDLLMELWAEGIEILVLHSTEDKVLHFAFPPGQALAGGKEASDRALGRFGPSGMMPGWRKTFIGEPNPGADHSDYWGDGAKEPSANATLRAGTFLKLGDLGREIGSARESIAPASLPEPREVGDFRELAEVG